MFGMLGRMIDDEGRRRIGLVVTKWMAYLGLTDSGIDREEGPLSRSTLGRAKKGEEMSEEMLLSIEHRLGLPIMFLTHIGEGDIRRIERSSADRDLVLYVIDLIREDRKVRRESKTG